MRIVGCPFCGQTPEIFSTSLVACTNDNCEGPATLVDIKVWNNAYWVKASDKSRAEVSLLVEALKYCSVDPGLLRPENNRQTAVAMNALAQYKDAVKEK